MSKRFLLLVLLFGLVACGAPAGEEETVAPDSANTENTGGESETAVDEVDGAFPAASVAEAAVVRNRDHVKGAEDAEVVIIEYGDFQ